MRATRTKIMTMFGALLLALMLVSPAAAAPAEHYQYNNDCYDFGAIFCFSGQGVYQETTTRSGVHKTTHKGTESLTITSYNGVVVGQTERQFNNTYVSQQGETQVLRQMGSASYTNFGETCTATYHTIFANGEVRHEMVSSDCV